MNGTLRVLQVGPLPPPVGGMATVIGDLTAELRKHCVVRVLNTVKTTSEDRPLWQGVSAQLRLLFRLGAICLRWRPQIVHVHTCSWGTFWRNGVDVLLARLLGRHVVLHVHGGEFHEFLASLTSRQAWLARRVLALAGAIIVLGTRWQTIIAPWCRPGAVEVVRNGVPVPKQVATGTSHGLPIILCLANYERRKGQADAISALARMTRTARLVLYGFASEPGQDTVLREHAAAQGVADRVDLPGPITGVAKTRAMLEGDLFCLPSYVEGMPMAMLEAMAAGLPVVATKVGSICEVIVADKEGMLVRPGDVAALAAAFDSLLADPQRRAAMAAAGRARIISEYSVSRVADDVMAVYRRLC